jgi:hypothetical protein
MKYLLLLFLALTLNSCDNDDDSPRDPISQLPPETMTGENTFGFILNGKAINIKNTNQIVAIYQQNQLQLGGDFENEFINISVSMFVGGPLAINTEYDISNQSIYIDLNQLNECRYSLEDTYFGKLFFTRVDEQNFIISGRFEFSTRLLNCDDIIIMQGRFDLQYIP